VPSGSPHVHLEPWAARTLASGHGTSPSSSVSGRALSCHSLGQRAPAALRRRPRPRALPDRAGPRRRPVSSLLPCPLSDGQSLPPAAGNAPRQSLARHAPTHWRLQPGLQPPARGPRGMCRKAASRSAAPRLPSRSRGRSASPCVLTWPRSLRASRHEMTAMRAVSRRSASTATR